MKNTMSQPAKQSYFDTLNQALESEGLIESWDTSQFGGIAYGQTKSWVWQDGSRYGKYISIYRNNEGRYERPIHYNC